MTILGSFVKQPAENDTYTINYADDLTVGDGIRTSVLTVAPAGLGITPPVLVDTRVRVWISGGISPVKYKITATTTTDDGRVMQDEFYVKVKDI